MRCPRCGKELVQERYESVTVDVCLTCGVWLDAGELDKVVADKEKTFTAAEIVEALKANAAGLAGEKNPNRAPCPKCGSCMDTFNYDYDTGIILDSCPFGHGAWLDRGELERVQIHMEHWDREAPKQKPGWEKLVLETNKELADREARAREARREMLGPAGRIIESAMNALGDIPGKP